MNRSVPDCSRVRFGAFELDNAGGELRKAGVLVKLQPQPFRVLSLLTEHAGQIVGREEIQHALWDGDTFVDFDRSINFCINQIRAALNDDPEKPRYVETLPRRGYRFIGSVEAQPVTIPAQAPRAESAPVAEAGRDASAVAASATVRTSSSRRKLLQTACGVAIFFLVWFAYYWLTPIPPPHVIRTAKITSSGDVDAWASAPLVTDGSRIYFLERRGGVWPAAATSINGGPTQNVRLPFRDNAKILDISPDRAEFLVGDFTVRGDEMPLWAVPVLGGSPRRIGNIKSEFAAWFPDGKRILYAKPDGIYQINQDGTETHRLTPTTGTPNHFSWSPNSRVLGFTLRDNKTGTTSLWEVSSDGANPHRLLSGWNDSAGVCCGSWTGDGKYYIFSAVRDGHRSIWAIREWGNLFHRTSRQPVQLTFGPTGFGEPLAEKGRNRIFFSVDPGWGDNLVRYDSKTRQFVPYLPGILFANDPLAFWHNEWAAYSAWTGGEEPTEIWKSRPDGTGRQQLTSFPRGTMGPRWSPDGKLLTFMGSASGNQLKSYVMSSDGGTPQELLPAGRASTDPDWSPDGKRLAFDVGANYMGWDESEAGIYQIDLQTRQYAKLPGSDGFSNPHWSPAGRYIAAETNDAHKLMLYDFETRRWLQLAQAVLLVNPTWANDGKSIYYQDAFEPAQPIYRIWIAGHKRERVADFEELINSGVVRSMFAGLAPDGSLLAKVNRNYGDIFAIDLDLP
ncbi:MAG TPA: winged helix-turn-helix domain-containing protein [Candidatus Acidoferrales bacterium]|nr:winged helix-turn-helix domain-containing protein [Candidatus Acidoferrales bacterium]